MRRKIFGISVAILVLFIPAVRSHFWGETNKTKPDPAKANFSEKSGGEIAAKALGLFGDISSPHQTGFFRGEAKKTGPSDFFSSSSVFPKGPPAFSLPEKKSTGLWPIGGLQRGEAPPSPRNIEIAVERPSPSSTGSFSDLRHPKEIEKAVDDLVFSEVSEAVAPDEVDGFPSDDDFDEIDGASLSGSGDKEREEFPFSFHDTLFSTKPIFKGEPRKKLETDGLDEVDGASTWSLLSGEDRPSISDSGDEGSEGDSDEKTILPKNNYDRLAWISDDDDATDFFWDAGAIESSPWKRTPLLRQNLIDIPDEDFLPSQIFPPSARTGLLKSRASSPVLDDIDGSFPDREDLGSLRPTWIFYTKDEDRLKELTKGVNTGDTPWQKETKVKYRPIIQTSPVSAVIVVDEPEAVADKGHVKKKASFFEPPPSPLSSPNGRLPKKMPPPLVAKKPTWDNRNFMGQKNTLTRGHTFGTARRFKDDTKGPWL